MSFKSWVNVLLFLNSYTPLWLIIFIRIILQNKVNSHQILGGIVLLSFLALSLPILLKLGKDFGSTRFLNIETKEDISYAYMGYIVSYIVPFAQQDYTKLESFAPMLIIIFIIMVFYIRSSLIYINPMLNLIGFNLFKIVDEHQNQYILLSKKADILRNIRINAVEFSENVLVEV